MKDFQQQVFCLTGVIPGLARADVWRHIEVRDGEWSERMTKEVTVLVVGERGVGTGKYEKAVQYGTELMKYTKFLAWIDSVPVVDKDAHVRPILEGSAKKYQCGAHVINPMTGEKNPLPWEQGEFDLKPEAVSGERLEVSEAHTPQSQGDSSPNLGEQPKVSTSEVSSSEAVTPEPEAVTSSEAITPEPKAVTSNLIEYAGKVAASIAAVFVIISKVLLVTCGVAICVCLWLVGIPASPPR